MKGQDSQDTTKHVISKNKYHIALATKNLPSGVYSTSFYTSSSSHNNSLSSGCYSAHIIDEKTNVQIFKVVKHIAAAAAKLLQSCPTLCDPIDGSQPGSPIPGILQARTTGVGCHFLLQCMRVKSESEVAQSCPTLSDPMDCSPPGSSIHGFSWQEYWTGVPFPSPMHESESEVAQSCPT